MKNLVLIIERSKGELWGRMNYEDDLLIESARTINSLERKMKKLLKDLHGVNDDDIIFTCQYDLAALFEKFNYLKITAIAEKAEMNAALLRQYVTCSKHPSARQTKKVESAIHKIGRELSKVTVHGQ